MSVTNEVAGDNILISVAENALERTVSVLLESSVDLLEGGGLVKTSSQIDNGNVRGRDTDGDTSELTVEGRNDLADGLGGTGAAGDQVSSSGTATTPVLRGGTVNGLLGGSVRVNGGHQTLSKAELVVDDLSKGGQAVGGAAGVGDDLVVGLVAVDVDTDNVHGGVSGRSGDHNTLGTTGNVSLGLLSGGEDTSGLNDVGDTGLAPGDLRGVTLVEDVDLLAVDDDTTISSLNSALEATVGRVVLEHVGSVVGLDEGVVNSNDVDLGVSEGVAENKTADTTETVNTNSELSHF